MSKQIINKGKLIYLDPIENIVLSNDIKEIAGVLNDDDHLLLDSLSIDAGVFAYLFENKIIKKVCNCKYVVRLQTKAFFNCSNLEKVDQFNNLEFIGDYAFSGCTNLKELHITNKVKYIGAYAFSGVKELNIKFGGTLEEWNKIEKNFDVRQDDWMPNVLILKTKDTVTIFKKDQ